MFTCFTCCPSTKGLIKDITGHIKDMFLTKAVRVRRRRKKQPAEKEEQLEADGQGGGAASAEEEEEEEWVAEPEIGVLLTLLALPGGRNHIKKIRFSKEVFDDWGAQKWWTENYDKIMELYNVASSTHSSPRPSSSSHDDVYQLTGEATSNNDDALLNSNPTEEETTTKPQPPTLATAAAAGESAAAGCGEGALRKASEWVVEDEAGVFITVGSTPDGSREILRVELSRERFGEVKARVWWEENKARLHAQYSS